VISEIKIENFKSIEDLALKPGRVTVLIGENGSGKSNILEAIAFAACATTDKLDNEFLFNRGVRVTDYPWMVSAFPENDSQQTADKRIQFVFENGNNEPLNISVFKNKNDANWQVWSKYNEEFNLKFNSQLDLLLKEKGDMEAVFECFSKSLPVHRLLHTSESYQLSDYIIYSIENSILRTQPLEGGIQPLGTKGQGGKRREILKWV
jgi:AAA15 family ATPase/GTPase